MDRFLIIGCVPVSYHKQAVRGYKMRVLVQAPPRFHKDLDAMLGWAGPDQEPDVGDYDICVVGVQVCRGSLFRTLDLAHSIARTPCK